MPNEPMPRGLWAAVLFLPLALGSCKGPWVDLSRLEVTTWPENDNQVLAADDQVRVAFSLPVRRTSAESLLRVTSSGGGVTGDLSWSGSTLVWTSVQGLDPGVRYNLEFNGSVETADGRRFSVVREVPFFSGSAADPVRLVAFAPGAGVSVSTTEPLTLTFSAAVDQVSFLAGLLLSPSTVTTQTWSSDGTVVTIVPSPAWKGATLYSWRLSGVRSADGVPLDGAAHNFLTGADQTPPTILDVVPALWAPPVSAWTAAGADLSQLRNGDALLITTSEAVDPASLETALRLSPDLRGHVTAQNASSPFEYVYVFDEDLVPDTGYSLLITTELKDAAGNSLQMPFLEDFFPAVPYLRVQEIDLRGVSASAYPAADLNRPNFLPLCQPSGVAGSFEITATAVFSESFSDLDKTQFALLSLCLPLFPNDQGLAAPTLVSVAFDTRRVTLTYRGFSVNPSAGAPYYYRLKIPGGEGGIRASGSPLKEDVWIDFATGS